MEKRFPDAFLILVPADVVRAIDNIKKRDKPAKGFMALQDLATGGPGAFIKHVFDVKQKSHLRWRKMASLRSRDELVDEGRGGVDYKIEAAVDADAVLARWDQKRRKLR